MSTTPITADFEERRAAQLDELYTAVYDELRRLANYYMRQERSAHTLQPTALVHEAYLRLSKQSEFHFENRTQFIAVAAEMMRRILINHAVHRRRQKREGGMLRVTLDRALGVFDEREMDLIALNEALNSLKQLDTRQERIFELRFFGGLSVEETAQVLDVSPATVKRDWTIAKLYLQRELGRDKK